MAKYPAQWERHLTLPDGSSIFIRPIRPEDETLYGPFLAAETPEDLRLRFFAPVKAFSPSLLKRFTQLDYKTAVALIALGEETGEMLGIARLHQVPGNDTAEYAIMVRSDLKNHGLGWQLMQLLIVCARERGFRSIQGQVLHENVTMLDMCKELGFAIQTNPNERDVCDVSLAL